MPVSNKIIRTRLRSVRNTKKITKAMELVSAAKMRKTVNATNGARPYANMAQQIIQRLQQQDGHLQHPLLAKPVNLQRQLIILIAGNRGLCGGFNASIHALANQYVAQRTNCPSDWIAVGRYAALAIARAHQNLVATFPKPEIGAQSNDVLPWVGLAITGFLNHTYDRVVIAHTHFQSALIQRPIIEQLLPFTLPETEQLTKEYIFEPEPKILLDYILPRLIETRAYQALLESSASEHSARMLAMRNATDAATDMIDGLTLAYNQTRQAAITNEIAEISSGKAVLE